MTKEEVISKALNLIDALNSLPDDTVIIGADINEDYYNYPQLCGVRIQVTERTAPKTETFSEAGDRVKHHFLLRDNFTISWITADEEEAGKNADG